MLIMSMKSHSFCVLLSTILDIISKENELLPKRGNLLSSHENAILLVEEGNYEKSPRVQVHDNKT